MAKIGISPQNSIELFKNVKIAYLGFLSLFFRSKLHNFSPIYDRKTCKTNHKYKSIVKIRKNPVKDINGPYNNSLMCL
jgi:hypothetical protein